MAYKQLTILAQIKQEMFATNLGKMQLKPLTVRANQLL